ncbi:chemotaxis protein methyltransferase CheR [Azospirillum lipoferum]|nr:chemotaxis protein methyltransferase CheR [Azospirillum lipoferum]
MTASRRTGMTETGAPDSDGRDSDAAERLRDILARRLGMAFADERRDRFADLLSTRPWAAGCPDAGTYLALLERAPPDHPELRALAERLTVNETYFFRHIDQITAFSEVALTERARSSAGSRRLRILSAGCSSGEEPYSLAMAARIHPLLAGGDWDIAVTGLDIDSAQIARARHGVYSEWALRATPEDQRARHFRNVGRALHLDPRIRAMVAFETRNLMDEDPAFWAEHRFDIIFCRNVLMYFTVPAMRAVVGRLARSLAPGGFLFLGAAETLRGISGDFDLCHTHDSFYYRRPAAPGGAGGAGGGCPPDLPLPPAVAGPPPCEPAPSWPDEIAKASDRITALLAALAPHEAEPPERPAPSPAGVAAADALAARPAAPRQLEAVRSLLHRERHHDAVRALDALPPDVRDHPDAQLLLAVALTQRSAVRPAGEVCRRLLAQDGRNAGAHYLIALCADHDGDPAAAWEHARTAAYLDPGFAMPHVHMGRLARAGRRPDAARRAFRQAITLLEREDASRILLFGGGFNRETLLRLCRAELLATGRPA